MKRIHVLGGVALFVLGMFAGSGINLVAKLKAQDFQGQGARPAEGYAFWHGAMDDAKFGYLSGFLDAELYYRAAIDRGFQPQCGDQGKKAISDFEAHYPVPDAITLDQFKHGIDLFYSDTDNRAIGLFPASNIVRLKLMGRPDAEVQDQLQRARSAQQN